MANPVAKIDFAVNDDCASICALIERVQKARARSRGGPYSVDFSKCTYVGPDAAATAAAIVLGARALNQRCDLRMPLGPKALVNFCTYSGLADMGRPIAYVNKPFDPSTSVFRMRLVRTASFRDADPVIDLVRAHIDVKPDIEELLRVCVNEVVQNIEDHSASPFGGVICARYLRNAKQVRVAIVDGGRGIHGSLSTRYPEIKTSDESLKRVLEGRYTALSRANNAGLGINHLRSIVETLEGRMDIISGNARAMVRSGFLKCDEMPTTYDGTCVFFALPVIDE